MADRAVRSAVAHLAGSAAGTHSTAVHVGLLVIQVVVEARVGDADKPVVVASARGAVEIVAALLSVGAPGARAATVHVGLVIVLVMIYAMERGARE
jgi:hypothetical protein